MKDDEGLILAWVQGKMLTLNGRRSCRFCSTTTILQQARVLWIEELIGCSLQPQFILLFKTRKNGSNTSQHASLPSPTHQRTRRQPLFQRIRIVHASRKTEMQSHPMGKAQPISYHLSRPMRKVGVLCSCDVLSRLSCHITSEDTIWRATPAKEHL